MSGDEAKSFAQRWSDLLNSANDDEFLRRRRKDAMVKRREADAIERELARNGYDVRSVISPNRNAESDTASWEEGDLSCDSCEAVMHSLYLRRSE